MHWLAQTRATAGHPSMLKIAVTLSIVVLGVLLAAPADALEDGRSADSRYLAAPSATGRERDLDIQPRGQRDQTQPGGDAYRTNEFDDDEIYGEEPEETPPADCRL